MSDNDEKRAFDPFELATALLLGFAAVGGAVAGFQSGQWGGRQLDAFSMANTLTTRAATQYNEDTVLMNADYAAVAVAKQHILEARDTHDATARERHLDMASYFYTTQLSEKAYKAMGLPMQYYVEDEPDKDEHGAGEQHEGKTAAAAPAAAKAKPSPTPVPAHAAGDEDAEPDHESALERDIPDADLVKSLSAELDEKYGEAMLAEGTNMFADADKKFEEGRQANENGDQFQLAGVFYTVALFFGGVGLVFKTRMRWGFFTAGLLILLASCVYIALLPWA